MAQWRIKEISVMTDVSVRMLHHYDKIGLLKPSMRSSNGYRWYSEQDLARLQQIVAFKFFGFSLRQIKIMLQKKLAIHTHLQAQQQMLADQSEHLRRIHDALATVLKQADSSAESLDWNSLVTLIERYHMIDALKNTWVSKIDEEGQVKYVTIKKAYPKEVGEWEKSVESINNMQVGDPEGPDGERIAQAFLKFQKALLTWEKETKANAKKMTKEQADKLLKNIEKFRTEGIPFNAEGNAWFAQALAAYRLRQWVHMYQEIAKNLDATPEGEVGKKLAKQWRDLVAENCWGEKDMVLGHLFMMDAFRTKALRKTQQPMTEDLKGCSDPMGIDWILKALTAH